MANPSERVVFTRQSAVRIKDAVRAVEGGNRSASALTFGRFAPPASNVQIRFAYYTATTNWTVAAYTAATNTSNTKTIQFAFPTSTPVQTALCVNHLASMPRLTTVATNAVVSVLAFKEGGMWRLIGGQL